MATTQLKKSWNYQSYPHVGAVTLLLSGDARLERCQHLTLNYIKMLCLEKNKRGYTQFFLFFDRIA